MIWDHQHIWQRNNTTDWHYCTGYTRARIQHWRNTSCHDSWVHAAERAHYDDLACVFSTALFTQIQLHSHHIIDALQCFEADG